MDECAYRPTVSGSVRWSSNGGFCYFEPSRLPFDIEIDDRMRSKLDSALITMGRLDGKVSQLSPGERDILTLAFTLKESTLSSAIEGTGTTMADLYRSVRKIETDPIKAADNREVSNYKSALDLGLSMVSDDKTISEALMMRMHEILLDGVCGNDKQPGIYRDSQVMVGMHGDTIETARYVPMPPEEVPWAMDNWFEYVNGNVGNIIVKTALAHYQFETIHPFKDGNGRIGRLMIMLMLNMGGVFSYPVLYLSEFFNRNRGEYIDCLSRIRESDAFDDWLEFFIKALTVQSESSMRLIDSLSSYRKELLDGETSLTIARTIEMLFMNPYIRVSDVSTNLGISIPSATRAIDALVERGVLRETTGHKRNRLFVSDRILGMLE